VVFHALVVVFTTLMLALLIGGSRLPNLPRFRAGYVFWDKPWFVVNVVSTASAAIAVALLFRCRESAAYFATVVCLCRVLGYFGLNPGGISLQHQSLTSLSGVVVSLGLAASVWWLRRRGVLK
jgi:hypothetical protein